MVSIVLKYCHWPPAFLSVAKSIRYFGNTVFLHQKYQQNVNNREVQQQCEIHFLSFKDFSKVLQTLGNARGGCGNVAPIFLPAGILGSTWKLLGALANLLALNDFWKCNEYKKMETDGIWNGIMEGRIARNATRVQGMLCQRYQHQGFTALELGIQINKRISGLLIRENNSQQRKQKSSKGLMDHHSWKIYLVSEGTPGSRRKQVFCIALTW